MEGRSRFEAGFWVSFYCRSYGWVDDDDDDDEEPSRAVDIRFLLSILYTERRPNYYGMPPKSPYSLNLRNGIVDPFFRRIESCVVFLDRF